MYICPVCRKELIQNGKSLVCENRHNFDISASGYVNLLTGSGKNHGDDPEMVAARRRFLNRGYYSPLCDAVINECRKAAPSYLLDAGCGEGYYTDQLAKRFPDRAFYGFDLSKEMVRLAAKRRCGAQFFVANIASIPITDGAIDLALHLFAPFHAAEFTRILRPGGMLVTVIPGKRHLYGLKEILYDQPYENDEQAPSLGDLRLTERIRVKGEIRLTSQDDIHAILQMTPYAYHTPTAGLERLEQCDTLTTEIEFVLLCCQKETTG